MTEQSYTVTVATDLAPSVLFAAITRPAVHLQADGSSMLRELSADTPERITGVGQIFGMEMTAEDGIREYPVSNHVTVFEPDRRLAWLPAGRGKPPVGVEWTWAFEPDGAGTVVSVTCDWSKISDPAYLAKHNLPRVKPEQVRRTVDAVIALARA